MPITCPCCNQTVDDAAIFCDICGAPLKEPELPVSILRQSPQPVQAVAAAAPVGIQTSTCPNCGAPYVAGEVFCNDCGVQLPPVAVSTPPLPVSIAAGEAPPVPLAPEPVIPTAAAVPVSINQVEQPASIPTTPQGPFITGTLVAKDTNTSIPLPPGKTEILIGRIDPVNSIFPEVDTSPYGGIEHGVSRRHCKLLLDNEQLCVEDFGSANFTYINRTRLQPGQKQPLFPGDELRLGGLIFIYLQ